MIYSSESRFGLTGLQNLENNSFMNSGLQCLSNAYELTEYFIFNKFIRDINLLNPIGSKGYLAAAYSELIKKIWIANNTHVSPWNLKKIIEKYANQFYHYSQLDSQVFLSYLLDGLHEDLNKIKKKFVVETIDLENINEDEVAKVAWDKHLKRNNSVIVDLFHGQFKSTLVCPDCKKVSINFVPFNIVSLPIPTIVYKQIYFYFIFKDPQKCPVKITMNLPENITAVEILTKIASILKMNKSSLFMCLLKEHKYQEKVTDEKTLSYILNHPGLSFVFELFPGMPESKSDSDDDTCMKMEQIKLDNQQIKKGQEKEKKPKMKDEDDDTALLHGNSELIKAEPLIKKGERENNESANIKKVEPPKMSFNEQIKQKEETLKTNKYIPNSQESKSRLKNALFIKVMVKQQSKAFYDADKNISYSRLLYLENDLTFEEIHHIIYLKFRQNIAQYVSKENDKININIDLGTQSYDVLALEYRTLFTENQESHMLYKLKVSHQDIQNNLIKPCNLCNKKRCKGCNLPCVKDMVLSSLLNKTNIDGWEMSLEVIFSKFVKIEKLRLNKVEDFFTKDSNENKYKDSIPIYDCISLLAHFKNETEDIFYCRSCNEHKKTTKTMTIFKEPKYLILHLKRFKTTKDNSLFSSAKEKNTSFVSFPLNGLDLTEYFSGNKEKKNKIYDLFAVSNHYEEINGGHYTAYAKNIYDNKWYEFKDSQVIEVSPDKIISKEAYMLFYKIRENVVET